LQVDFQELWVNVERRYDRIISVRILPEAPMNSRKNTLGISISIEVPGATSWCSMRATRRRSPKRASRPRGGR
jgi:hypothetical protein